MAFNVDNNDSNNEDAFWADEEAPDTSNPFGIEEEEPEVEAPEDEEVEDDGEEEVEETEEEEPQAEEEEQYEYDPDLLPEPVVVGGRTITTFSELARAAQTAQDHIDRTARAERTPLQEALGGSGGNAWKADWDTLSAPDQDMLKDAFQRDPAGTAQLLANDVTIVGRHLTQLIWDEWYKLEPGAALNFRDEQIARAHAGSEEPQQNDPYIQQMIDQAQSTEAEQLLVENVPGWTEEAAQETAQFILEYGEELGALDVGDSPEEMASFVASVFYYMEGQKTAASRVAQPNVEDTPAKARSKKRAATPVKSSASPSTGSDDEELDDIFSSPSDGFKLPLK